MISQIPQPLHPRHILWAGLTVLWVAGSSWAIAGNDLHLAQPQPGELLSADFRLEQPAKLKVEAVGLVAKHGGSYVVDAWILNHDNRQPVWTFGTKERDCTEMSRLLHRGEDKVHLDKGWYTVYLYAGTHYYSEQPFKSWQHFLHDLAALLNREDPNKDYQKYLNECFVDLTLPLGATIAECNEDKEKCQEATIQLTCAQDGIFFSRPVRVAQDTRIELYTIGEAIWRGELLADYAWIERASDGQTIWLMDMPNCEHAGGALKNRAFRGEITLARGEYLINYITDESHSCEAWNANPPFDPRGWGLVVKPAQGHRQDEIVTIDFNEITPDPEVLVKMIHVGNDEHRHKKFRLEQASRVRVFALGEGGHDEMWDTAWILDKKKRRTVWRMDYHDTRNGGGDKKNRIYDGVIELSPGVYEAHYATDDSHAFGSWNARPPTEPHRWGLTVTLVEEIPIRNTSRR
jgi:hypothetical protein